MLLQTSLNFATCRVFPMGENSVFAPFHEHLKHLKEIKTGAVLDMEDVKEDCFQLIVMQIMERSRRGWRKERICRSL